MRLQKTLKSTNIFFWTFTAIAILFAIHAYLPLDVFNFKFIEFTLIAILILSGGIVFWNNKKSLGKDLIKTKRDEQLKETSRKRKFSKKYPKLNRLPILNHLVRWAYKEGLIYVLIFVMLIIIAFILRAHNLDVLEPYDDEYSHLVSAMAVNNHGEPNTFISENLKLPYERFYFLTYLIAFLFSVFGKSLFIARLPGVIISTLTAIPFYFIGRKINKNIGLIMAALWAISPWAIAISRNVREYAYFPFLYAFIGLFFIVCAKNLIKIIEEKHWKLTFYRSISLIIFFLPLLYYFSDPKSTFMFVFILYAVFFAVLFYGIFRSKKLTQKIKKKIGVFLLIPVSIFAVIAYSNVGFLFEKHISIIPQFNRFWFDVVLGKFDGTFFYQGNYYGFYALFALGILFSFYWLIKNKSQTLTFLILTFLGYFYVFSFHLERIENPRRLGFVIHLWLIPIIAIGIYCFYKLYLNKIHKRKIVAAILVSIFLVTVFNFKNIAKATNLDSYRWSNGSVQITSEYHERFIPVLEKYGNQIKKDDATICTLCNPLLWHEAVDLMDNNLYYYDHLDENRLEMVPYIVQKYPSGWMILEWKRNDSRDRLPRKNLLFQLESGEYAEMKFIEKHGDFYIYHWKY